MLHEGENVGIVGSRSDYELSVAECVLDSLSHILAGEVAYRYLGTAERGQLFSEQLRSFFCISVNGRICDEHALGFHAVARPCVVQTEIVAEILLQHGTVQRTDGLDIERRSLLQERLDLHTVLADDTEVVASCLARPVLVSVERTELAERVRGEEHLVGLFVGEHDLRPVHHGSKHECEFVLSEGERVPVLDLELFVTEVELLEEAGHHREGLSVADDDCVGELTDEVHDVGGVVGLHVLNDEVVGLPAAERFVEVCEPLIGEVFVNGVEHSDLLVEYDIGIVSHAVGDDVLTLEEVEIVVVDAYVKNVVCYVYHLRIPLSTV